MGYRQYIWLVIYLERAVVRISFRRCMVFDTNCVTTYGRPRTKDTVPRKKMKMIRNPPAFDFFERYLFKDSFKRLEIGRYPLPFLVNSLV